MVEKQKFADRWPIRNFAVQINTMFARCETGICSVTGVVNWDVSSPDRNAHSTGSANFVVRVAVPPTGPASIISENGSVLSNHLDSLVQNPPAAQEPTATVQPPDLPRSIQPAANGSAGFANGRTARIEYENWFAAIPEGPFRDGAAWWAGNRSASRRPSCYQPGAAQDWITGCLTALSKLTPIDVQRKSDHDFWLGWNSL
jgi:hypothetical protein